MVVTEALLECEEGDRDVVDGGGGIVGGDVVVGGEGGESTSLDTKDSTV